jgi:adenosine deaminase
MSVGFLCIASRDFGVDEVARTAEFFIKHQARFAGFDLAGNEAGFPCRLFESSFQKLRAAGAAITVHAGEGSGAENMWEAIERLGARRIGHGIACIQDAKLMEHLRDRSICLEVCPTSNWLTRCVPSLAAHPLPLILKSGIPVCINTDDPGIFDVSMPGEIRICREQMGLSEAEIAQCAAHASKASFLP